MTSISRAPRWAGTALAALLLAPAPAVAQDWGVVRQSYLYADTRLVVDVRADVPGEIQIIRGSRGWLDVAARADQGIAGMALGGHRREELVLTSMGAGRVLYLVTVPENARVDVRLPGSRMGQAFWPPRDMVRYTWGGSTAASSPASPRAEEAPPHGGRAAHTARLARDADAASAEGAYTAFASPRAPARVEVPRGAAVRTLIVRFEQADGFRVAAERPMSVTGTGQRRLRVHPRGEPVDLVLVVPRGTRDFALHFGGAEVLRVDDGQAHALCGPVTDQRLEGGERRFSFSPPDTGMECGDS